MLMRGKDPGDFESFEDLVRFVVARRLELPEEDRDEVMHYASQILADRASHLGLINLGVISLDTADLSLLFLNQTIAKHTETPEFQKDVLQNLLGSDPLEALDLFMGTVISPDVIVKRVLERSHIKARTKIFDRYPAALSGFVMAYRSALDGVALIFEEEAVARYIAIDHLNKLQDAILEFAFIYNASAEKTNDDRIRAIYRLFELLSPALDDISKNLNTPIEGLPAIFEDLMMALVHGPAQQAAIEKTLAQHIPFVAREHFGASSFFMGYVVNFASAETRNQVAAALPLYTPEMDPVFQRNVNPGDLVHAMMSAGSIPTK